MTAAERPLLEHSRAPAAAAPPVDESSRWTSSATILWVSVLGLYLELLLIRWIGTEIRIFAHLQNTVLVVCFLGLGVGLFTARQRVAPMRVVVPLALLAGALSFPPTRRALLGISDLLNVLGDVNIFGGRSASGPVHAALSVAVGLFLTLVVMTLVVEVFIPVGRVLGRSMDAHPRTIVAYSLNVGGSLLGIWLFVLLSRLNQPPAIWFVVLTLLLLPFLARQPRASASVALGLALVLGLSAWGARQEGPLRTVWSPYQKLSLWRAEDLFGNGLRERFVITVNNVGYQEMVDLRPETITRDTVYFPRRQRGFSQYDVPMLVHPDPRRVLIVGSGTGNDVAGALRNGADRVTAVDIDPAILTLGRELHPERPYDDPRVRVVNDDARSFFARTTEKYDLIVFGLLDAHTTTAMTNARLDHYVYTRESMKRARELLADGGVLALSFEAFRPFIADRIAVTLRDLFGEEPHVFRIPGNYYGWGCVLFLTGDLETVRRRIAGNPQLAGLIDEWRRSRPVPLSYTTRPATDDWPYLYLAGPGIPPLFLMLTGLVCLLLVPLRHRLEKTGSLNPIRWTGSHWHFFFLGAAFLLLEVQNISKASVALGNTWLVNAVIITGVLAMVLLANATALFRPRLRVGPVYGALLLVAASLYFLDLARLAFLPFVTKAIAVGALTTLPMYFSGLVFIRSFAGVERKDTALGANLLGALVGGLLQSLSFLTGIRSLLLVVVALYACAWLTNPLARRARRGVPEEAPGRAAHLRGVAVSG